MDTLINIAEALVGANITTLLLIFGFLFFFIGIFGNKIQVVVSDISGTQRWLSFTTGILFMTFSIGLILVKEFSPAPDISTPIAVVNTLSPTSPPSHTPLPTHTIPPTATSAVTQTATVTLTATPTRTYTPSRIPTNTPAPSSTSTQTSIPTTTSIQSSATPLIAYCSTADIDAKSDPRIIPEWRNPSAGGTIQIFIPDGYAILWVSSDPASFNGRYISTRVVIASEVNLLVEGITWNEGDGHYNIWAVASRAGCTASDLFNRHGFDYAPIALTINSNGEISEY